MILPLATLMLLTTGAGPAEKQIRFASMEIVPIGFPKTATAFIGFLSDHAADQFAAEGLRVTTPKEIKALIGLERQRQLMGCADDSSSCAAELANALGVDGIILTDVAKIGTVYKLNVKVLDAATTERVASFSTRANSQEALLEAFTQAAKELAPILKSKFKDKKTQTPLSEVKVPEQATSPPDGKSDDPRLTRAIERFDALDFGPADELLGKVIADPASNSADRAIAWKYRAAVKSAEGKPLEMEAALKALIETDRTARFELDAFDPELRTRHQALLLTMPEKPLHTGIQEAPAVAEVAKTGNTNVRVLAPAILGGAALATGVVFLAMAKGTETHIISGPVATRAELDELTSKGASQQMIGLVAGGLGLVGLAVAGAMFAIGDDDAAVSLLPSANGGAVVLTGSF